MNIISQLAWFWFIFGCVLTISEFLLPGLVAVFLGASAIIVAGLCKLDLVTNWISSITIWMIISLVLLLTLRQIAAKWLPSESEIKHVDDDIDAIGARVLVVKDVVSENDDGRIRYQGTEWPARTSEGTASKGQYSEIKFRENITWIIESTLNGEEL